MTSKSEFPLSSGANRVVPGIVTMSLDVDGIAQAVSATNPMPVTLEAGSVSLGGISIANGEKIYLKGF